MRAAALALLVSLALAVAPSRAAAEWEPPLQAATTTLAAVLAANARETGTANPAFTQRRERYVYRTGTRALPVEVAVAGDDYLARVRLGHARYLSGRYHGVVWRADANGIAHDTLSDLQGDPLDRVPRSLFPFDAATCTLAGETTDAQRAWVVLDRPPRDKPHWFFIDRTSGLIVREATRVGKRTVTTTFEDFEPIAGTLRPRRWHVRDGDAADDLDVQVDAIEPRAVDDASLAPPPKMRVFAPIDARAPVVPLAARFQDGSVVVDVELAGRRARFLLDTGTPAIILDRDLAARWGFAPALGHANVPRMAVGALVRHDVSVLTAPLRGGFGAIDGILGYDFFVGNVVHVDYLHHRVAVYARDAASRVFDDPATTVLATNVDEGMPLVRAAFGSAVGERFAVDTGSPHLYVFDPFAGRYASEIAASWTPVRFADGRPRERERYLEGTIWVEARRVAAFEFGAARFVRFTVGVQQPLDDPDAIAIPLDGIIGTDELSRFDLWFDYDGGRIGMRTVELVEDG
jgi:hypothetical protein